MGGVCLWRYQKKSWENLVRPCVVHMAKAAYCCACGNRGCLRIGRCLETWGDTPSFFPSYLQACTVSQINRLYFRERMGEIWLHSAARQAVHWGLPSEILIRNSSIWRFVITSLNPLSRTWQVVEVYVWQIGTPSCLGRHNFWMEIRCQQPRQIKVFRAFWRSKCFKSRRMVCRG